jgi:hypothetical protein
LWGKNPKNKNLSVGNPEIDNAAVTAAGPGIGIILQSPPLMLKTSSINLLPGSDIPGVPASVISAASLFLKIFISSEILF